MRVSDKAERARIIEQRMDAFLAEAHWLGCAPDDRLAAFRRRQAAMERNPALEETNERLRD